MKISKLYKEIATVAYPLIIMNATSTIMEFVDRKFLSMHSTEDVSAALPAGILSFTLLAMFVITTRFTGAIVSQHYGRKDFESCSKVIWSSFYFAICAGLISSYLLLPLGCYLIQLGNHSAEIIHLEELYFTAIIPSGGFMCISIAFSSFFTGRGKTWIVTIINFAACLLNVFLDYGMIFGKFGFPALGIAGAGMATTISIAFSALLAFLFFIMQNQSKYPTRRNKKFNFHDMKKLLLFGFPTGIQVFCEVGAFTVIIFLVGHLGNEELAATTIAMSINMISFLPLLGLSEATTIICGKYIGKNKKKTAEQVVYKAWKIGTVYMAFMVSIFLFFPNFLFSIFAPVNQSGIDFSKVMQYGKIILICAGIYNFSDVTFFIFNAGLRAAGDTKFSMWVTIIASWFVLVPVVSILVLLFNVPLVVVWICLVIFLMCVSIIIYSRFKSGSWKNIALLGDKS